MIQVWILASRPARVAILAVPAVAIAMVFWPRIESSLQSPAGFTKIERSFGQRLRGRAAMQIEEDFGSGLSGWDGGSGETVGWTSDPAGFVRPGRLALLSASRLLSNYRLEVVGLIEQRSLGWAFRASDLQNYYAMKIVIAKPGPVPQGAIVRYTVINGVAVDRVQFPLPLSVRNDTIYHIESSVYQDRFVTTVNGQVVDTFFDRRHAFGGVGLFSEPGEDARILRVRVADRDDLLGRICAYFSRNSADNPAGSPAFLGKPAMGPIQPRVKPEERH